MIDRQKFFKLVTAIAAGTAIAQAAAGCSSSTNNGQTGACTPGETKSCACPGNASGTQTCKSDGSGYEACAGCPTGTGGASGSGGASTSSGGATTGTGGASGSGGTSSSGGTNGTGGGTGGAAISDAGPTTLPGDAGFVQSDAGGSACGACTGCCASGTCVPLPSQTATQCGVNAMECAACGASEICAAGACVAATSGCSPSTCPTGCCIEGSCILPHVQSYTACGGGGLACGVCDWGVLCTNATCTTEIDPSAQFYIAVDELQVMEKDGSGNAWDPLGGLPDPFVCFTDGLVTGCNKPQSDTTTVSWSGSAAYLADSSGNPVLFSAQQITSGALQFSVWDYDPYDPNDLVQNGQYPTGIFNKQTPFVVGNFGRIIGMSWRLYP